ncbi:MAG: DEAD/DEAH box helicase, partial [Acetobacteraceae bacterium]
MAIFAIEVAETGLAPETELSDLAKLEHAHAEWRSICEALAADPVSQASGGPPPSAEIIKATIDFAEAAAAALPQGAASLLAEGWPAEQVQALRGAAEAASRDLGRLVEVTAPLKSLGLPSFARVILQGGRRDAAIASRRFLDGRRSLPGFLHYAQARRACREDRLAGIVLSAYEDSGRPLSHMAEALQWLIAWTSVRRHAENHRDVFNQNGGQLDASRRSFAVADRANMDRDAKVVRAQALRRIPPPGSNLGHKAEWTEAVLLKNEFSKSTRHIAVRDLLGRAGKAVQALAPCMMMSPLTVAQYLPPGEVEFDVVIMDEASQIAPAHAIGALLRSKQAIIVGDSQQLPPTDFFDRSSEDAAEAEAAEEQSEDATMVAPDDKITAKSVLDLARNGFAAKPRRLLWHYRSKHESLISFSNREFYPNGQGDGSLIVFPSAEHVGEMLGVELVQVPGTRQNRENVIEARAIAEAAARFAHTHSDLSLGIVAMNIPQRVRIEDELQQLAARDPAWERYQDSWNERLEPCFVKNLENVQGDERDAIFISLGWGPTPEGAFHQRFFPVNREFDGPRRLNVLFTRARRKVLLFASFAAEQIRVDERTPRGPRILR